MALQLTVGQTVAMTAPEVATGAGLDAEPLPGGVWQFSTWPEHVLPPGLSVAGGKLSGTVADGATLDDATAYVVHLTDSPVYDDVTGQAYLTVTAAAAPDPTPDPDPTTTPTPTLVDRVLVLVEGEEEDRKLAEEAVTMVTAMAKSYTRGVGFTTKASDALDWTLPVTLGETTTAPNEEIAAVILTASARLLANPSQLGGSTTVGPFSSSFSGGFTGWTLVEQFVLNRYRKRAH